MRPGWRDVTLGDIFNISSSKRVLQQQWKSKGVPFYRAREIVKLSKLGEVQNELFISEELFEEFKTKYGAPQPGDLMVSAVGTLGACYVVKPGDRFYFKDASVLRFSPKEPVDSRFIQRAFGTAHIINQIHSGSGSTVGTFTISRAQKTIIPLPPLAEQKRIAAILDAVDALRTKRRESLAQLDTLLQSTFIDLFGDPVTNPKGWEVGRLSDVVERLDGGKNVAQSETETGFRVLKVSAVTSGEYRPEESKYLPADFKVPQSYLVREGDLLISRANTIELIGATAYVWETPKNIALPDKIWKFIWKKDAQVKPLFIYHLSQDPEFRRILGSRASGTSGSMKNIAKPKLLSMPIPLPPLDLQGRFSTIVESAEQQKVRVRKHLAELDALFVSLQQRAFNGEL